MNAARREAVRSGALFVLTLATVTIFSIDGVLYTGSWRHALAFSVSLMAILGAHEAAHYVVARHHGFRLTLPVFIPLPLSFGTMGAVIRLKSLPKTRQALLEMGVAGPIAGAIVAFVLLAVSLPWIEPAPAPITGERIVFNDPLVVKLLGTLILGAPPDRYAIYHPVSLAAWVGCLLTGINLVPIGQLDGGHVLNAAAPRVARVVSRVGPFVALAAGFLWLGWAVWGGLLLLLGAWRPLPVDDEPPLPLRSRLLALAALVLFALTFMPLPVQVERIGGAP